MFKFKLFTVGAFIMALLIACSDGEETGSVDGEEGSMDSEEAELAEEETGEVEEVDEPQGELRYAFNTQPTTLDVQMTTATVTREIGRPIYESLVTFNSNYEVEPMLAEDFEISEDGSVVTFHLREGILFHNGDEMVADDVLASMEKWHGESAQAESFLGDVTYEVVDDYTFVANIDDPTTIDMSVFADYSQMAAIMPEEVINDAGTDGVTEYIGTGPFQFEEWSQDQYIHLSAFEDYQSRSEEADGFAGEKIAHFEDIYFDIVPDSSTRVNGVQTGEYDVIHATPHDNADMLGSDPNLENYLHEEGFPIMVLNNKEGFFSDQTAREAMNAALDPEAMLMGGYGSEEFFSLSHELMLEGNEWYTDAGQEIYETYDPELAEELLEEVGYNGEPVTILASRDYMEWYNIGVIIQQQLEEVGINVNLEVYDWATILDMRDDSSQYDAFMTGTSFRPIPVQYNFLSSELDYPGWTNSEEMDNAIDDILYADSLEEAYTLTGELQQIFWDYLPVYKPGYNYGVITHRSDLEGLVVQEGPILWNVKIGE